MYFQQGVNSRPVLLSSQQVMHGLIHHHPHVVPSEEDIKPPISPEHYCHPPVNINGTISTNSNTTQVSTTLPQENNKPYICTFPSCDRTFVHCRNLRQHETKAHGRVPPVIRRSIQSLNKPYSCPVNGCDKRFFHLQSIRRHITLCHMSQYQEYGYSELGEHTEKYNLIHTPHNNATGLNGTI